MTRDGKRKDPRSVTDFDEAIGRRIRLIRLDREMSQQELAERLGISFQQIQKYEKGNNRLSCERLVVAATQLGTTPHELLGWNSRLKKIAEIDEETYKLAQEFKALPEKWKRQVRNLIRGVIEVE